jgi:poly-gamma-glutamate capsule biosynthesis protein CapA/YwtB (metallophosphatase superfamily)
MHLVARALAARGTVSASQRRYRVIQRGKETMIEDDKQSSERPGTEDGDKPARVRRARPAAAKHTDARRDPEQLKRNRERLGVGSDHRTDAMKKGKRGTFP